MYSTLNVTKSRLRKAIYYDVIIHQDQRVALIKIDNLKSYAYLRYYSPK